MINTEFNNGQFLNKRMTSPPAPLLNERGEKRKNKMGQQKSPTHLIFPRNYEIHRESCFRVFHAKAVGRYVTFITI